MSYFPCDIPFMDEEELRAHGLSSLKETTGPGPDTISRKAVDPDTISRKAVVDGFWNLDIELRPSAIDKILRMIDSIPPKEDSDAAK